MNIINFKRSSKKLRTVLYIVLLVCILFLLLSAYAETPDNENSGFIEPVRELAPTLFSRVFTILIFIILCVLMLYFKFRKGNVNNE